jgi:NDP-sugar pyrophosphorylase family protein
MGYVASLLVGGRASRLGQLASDNAKCLIKFCETPFLELLISKLFHEHCQQVILITGYHEDLIERYVKEHLLDLYPITMIREEGGTAPAIRQALRIASSPDILCLNGDTILDIHYGDVVACHRASQYPMTLVSTDLREVPHCGAILVDTNNILLSFEEDKHIDEAKERHSCTGRRVSNCGCYCIRIGDVLPFMESLGGQSFERDVLPKLVQNVTVQNYTNGTKTFIDFGVPARLEKAQHQEEILRRIYYRRS